jgi:hypothetical protein
MVLEVVPMARSTRAVVHVRWACARYRDLDDRWILCLTCRPTSSM